MAERKAICLFMDLQLSVVSRHEDLVLVVELLDSLLCPVERVHRELIRENPAALPLIALRTRAGSDAAAMRRPLFQFPMRRPSTTDNLALHSRAKVRIIADYLAAYLNILERAREVEEVYVFDLMCGEGVYQNGERGTAVEIVDTVRRHYFSNQSGTNKVTVCLNDTGQSEVEPEIRKIDRVELACRPVVETLPPRIRVRYRCKDAIQLAADAVKRIEPGVRRKVLFIIDPRGYSQTPPQTLREILVHDGVEIVLFLPTSFMYRFRRAAWERGVRGTGHLKAILHELFPEGQVSFSSAEEFIGHFADRLDEYLGGDAYVTTVRLDSETGSRFDLILLTRNIRGLELMVEMAWKYDVQQGIGHRRGMDQQLLFDHRKDTFLRDLEDFIVDKPSGRSNMDVVHFVLRRGFRVEHVTKHLIAMKKAGTLSVEYSAGEGSPRSVYLSRTTRESHKVTLRIT